MKILAQFCRWLHALPVRLYRWLFDFSRGQEEGRRWERMLRSALAESRTEEEFLATMRRMVTEDEPLKTEIRWGFFMGRLSEYTAKETGDRRAGAERMLAALPRLYGFKPSTDESGSTF